VLLLETSATHIFGMIIALFHGLSSQKPTLADVVLGKRSLDSQLWEKIMVFPRSFTLPS
jgi:hypothetical protein